MDCVPLLETVCVHRPVVHPIKMDLCTALLPILKPARSRSKNDERNDSDVDMAPAHTSHERSNETGDIPHPRSNHDECINTPIGCRSTIIDREENGSSQAEFTAPFPSRGQADAEPSGMETPADRRTSAAKDAVNPVIPVRDNNIPNSRRTVDEVLPMEARFLMQPLPPQQLPELSRLLMMIRSIQTRVTVQPWPNQLLVPVVNCLPRMLHISHTSAVQLTLPPMMKLSLFKIMLRNTHRLLRTFCVEVNRAETFYSHVEKSLQDGRIPLYMLTLIFFGNSQHVT